jgi:anti-sigma-K factor RskA
LEDLELHALGTLPEGDAAALRAHVGVCANCAANLARAHGDAAMLAFAARQERPAGTVKAELMARIRANREAEERYAWPSRIRGAQGEEAKAKAESDAKSSWWNWVLVPAAVALALVSFGLSWQNRRITAELQKEHHAAEAFVHDREQIEKLVGMLAAPDTVTVRLTGTGDGPSASGVVKYNGKMGVMVYSAELPALATDESYQLWLVPAKGAPMNAGLIGPGGHAWGNLWTAEVPVNTEAKAFAVTIEPVGGVGQPTGPKVLVGTT